jgi:hypothetical protein
MKQFRILIAFALVTTIAVAAFTAAHLDSEKESYGLLRHVVSFKFKDDAPQDKIDAAIEAFANLEKEIPFIVDFEWGTNNSPEPHSQGFTHCFILTFKSAKDRDAYLPHPAHKAFGQTLGPILDKVFVIDYFTK